MKQGKISTVKVPGQGVSPSEAPGKTEEQEKLPFVGRSGELMNRHLERHGIIRRPAEGRSDPYVTNVCKYRPYKNDFKNLLGSSELQEGMAELREEIVACDPNVIIAMGGVPTRILTGKEGIMNYRGSVLPCTMVEGYKVYASLHPAYIERDFGMVPVFSEDLRRAVQQAQFKEICYPEYEEIVNPSPDRLWSLVEEMLEAEWLSVDIETFGPGSMSCFGVTDSADRGLCITFMNPSGWEAARILFESDVPKIMQYGTYDINFLKRFYGWEVGNFAFDTYIAAAELMPEFKKGLDFLTSIYTWFPYYKTERKVWKQEGDMSTLWSYNIKDIIATFMIAMQQMKELEKLYGWRYSGTGRSEGKGAESRNHA